MAFHVGDVGATVRLTIKEDGSALDISAATGLELEIQRPDGSTLDKTAVFTNAGADGLIEYVTVAGDLNVPGEYEAQAYFTLGAWTGHSERVEFQVFGNAV